MPLTSIRSPLRASAASSTRPASGSRRRMLLRPTVVRFSSGERTSWPPWSLRGTRRQQGEGGSVEIIGEPGIGKTALLNALVAETSGATWLHAWGDLYSASSAYRATRELLLPLLDVADDNLDARQVVARVAAVAERLAPDLIPWLPLIADILGESVTLTPEVASLSSERRRERLHEVVTQLLDVALPDAVLFTVEDSHWMDDASSALLCPSGSRGRGPILAYRDHSSRRGGWLHPARRCW